MAKSGRTKPASEKAPDAVAVLETLFGVVIAEARARPAFAKKLVAALPEGTVISVRGGAPRRTKKPDFNPLDVNPVVIIRSKGETALKFELGKRRTKKELLAIIRVHNLDVEAMVKRTGSLSDLRQAIIRAAIQRIDRDRAAAS